MEQEANRFNITERVIQSRIIHLFGEINGDVAKYVCTLLPILDDDDPEKPIHIYINSGGGCVHSGNAIISAMELVNAPVYTYNLSMAASMAAVILSCGKKRYATERSWTMIHRVSGGAEGNIQDVMKTIEHMNNLNDDLTDLMVQNSKISKEEYNKLTERDYWMRPEEAKEKGFIDEVLTKQYLEKMKNK